MEASGWSALGRIRCVKAIRSEVWVIDHSHSHFFLQRHCHDRWGPDRDVDLVEMAGAGTFIIGAVALAAVSGTGLTVVVW